MDANTMKSSPAMEHIMLANHYYVLPPGSGYFTNVKRRTDLLPKFDFLNDDDNDSEGTKKEEDSENTNEEIKKEIMNEPRKRRRLH